MGNKTAEEEKIWNILSKLKWIVPEYSKILGYKIQRGSGKYKEIMSAMEEYASIKLAEKDKEIESFAIRFAEWISSQNYKNHTSNGWSVVKRGAGSCDVKPTYSTEQLIELYKQSLNK